MSKYLSKYYSNDCKKHSFGLFDIFYKTNSYVYLCMYCRHMKITKNRMVSK